MSILELCLVIIICSLFAYFTYIRGMLDIRGSVTAFFIGMILGVMGGVLWILLLLIFLVSAFLATRYKFNYKITKDLQEGKKGERGAINVLANGIVPVIIAIFNSPASGRNLLGLGYLENNLAILLFVTSVACAASDTLASEMGMLSDKVYLITTGKRVSPGTDGGISLYGEMWALFGSAYTFFVAYIIFHHLSDITFPPAWPFIGITMGFISCQFDSLLGATLEQKGLIGKSSVNTIAISISMIITIVIIWLIAY